MEKQETIEKEMVEGVRNRKREQTGKNIKVLLLKMKNRGRGRSGC